MKAPNFKLIILVQQDKEYYIAEEVDKYVFDMLAKLDRAQSRWIYWMDKHSELQEELLELRKRYGYSDIK